MRALRPYPEYKPSGVEWLGKIPQGWSVAALDKVVQPARRITYGIVQPGSPDPNGIFMVRGQDYSDGWASPESVCRVSPAIELPYTRARLVPGDIVMTIVGAGVGNIAVVPPIFDGANITQTTARIAVSRMMGDGRYFAYLLESKVGRINVAQSIKGAAQPGLNLSDVKKYLIVVPPVDEQLEIAGFLDCETVKLDALTAKIGTGIERLQEYRTALISAAVTGKIDVRQASSRPGQTKGGSTLSSVE